MIFLVQDTQFPVKVTQYWRHKWLNGSHLKAVSTQALHKKLVRIRMILASDVPTYDSNAGAVLRIYIYVCVCVCVRAHTHTHTHTHTQNEAVYQCCK